MQTILLIVAVVGILSGNVFAQPGQWITRSPLPTPRQEIPHAVLNGKIYIPGGLTAGGVGSSIVEVFTPATNSWATIVPMPEPLHHLGFAAAGGKLYVLGGYTGSSFSPMNRTYVYLPDSNLWRRKADMPVARGAHIAVEFGGKIYLFGGITNVADSKRTDVYDTQTDTWTNLAAMPTAREHLAAAAIDSLIYIVGGRIGSTNTNTFEAYSPVTNRWYTKTSMPTARGGLAAAAMRGRLYVFGGEIPGVYPQNEEYNPATNTWRTMAPMPTPRHGIGAATVGDSIFIIGGATVAGFGVTDVNQAFTLAEPRFEVTPRQLDFGTLTIPSCKRDSVKVKNTGNAQLVISEIRSTNPRFSPTPTSATITAGESLWVRVNYCADFPTGLQTGNLLFTHNAQGARDTVQLRAQNTVTGISKDEELPDAFSLFQNYPNPFNPSTTVEYELPRATLVKLTVYNLLGEEVRTLANENRSAGRHSIQFTAEGLPSGMYFYRIQTPAFVQSRTMILLR